MIYYERGGFHFLHVIIRLRGSVLPRSIPVGLFAGAFCFCLLYFKWLPHKENSDISTLMAHPNPFAFFLQVAALTLAFHTNSAYQRFWEARTHLQSMASYWLDAASHIAAFDELTMIAAHKKINSNIVSEKASNTGMSLTNTTIADTAMAVQVECYKFRARMLHFFSLLHGVCIHYLFGKDGSGHKLEILGGISHTEAVELEEASDHAFLVSHWINQNVARHHIIEGGLPIGGPVLSRTWQLMYLGMFSYNQACKIEDTPFPFPYMQLMYILDISVALIAPVVIAVWVIYIPFAVCLTFLIVLTFDSLFQAAHLMESPFGQRPNDLPLLELHSDYINRLKMLADVTTAEYLRNLAVETCEADGGVNALPFAVWPVKIQTAMPSLAHLFSSQTSRFETTGIRDGSVETKRSIEWLPSIGSVKANRELDIPEQSFPVISAEASRSSDAAQMSRTLGLPTAKNRRIELIPSYSKKSFKTSESRTASRRQS